MKFSRVGGGVDDVGEVSVTFNSYLWINDFFNFILVKLLKDYLSRI